MQVSYLLDQRLKWLVVHNWHREATAGGLSVGRNLQGMGPPAAVRAPLHNRAECAGNLDSSAWWDRSLRWAAAGSWRRTTHRSTTSCSPARLRLVRRSASFRPPAGDSDRGIAAFYEAFSKRDCEPSCLRLFGTPERPVELLAAQDVIYVSGGNTANALALWRLHGVDEALRDAWRRGAVLGGASAGANCWFECCVTDSFGPALDPLHDGLGLVPGSFCPHYDGEELRRPVFRSLVDDGFPAGYAADDFAAFHFVGAELREVVSSREGARGYRVESGTETPIAARVL